MSAHMNVEMSESKLVNVQFCVICVKRCNTYKCYVAALQWTLQRYMRDDLGVSHCNGALHSCPLYGHGPSAVLFVWPSTLL